MKLPSPEKAARWCTIFGFPTVVITIAIGVYQIKSSIEGVSSQNNIALASKIYGQEFEPIRNAIDHDEDLLTENGGDFSDTQLDDYLANFDTIKSSLEKGFLREHDLCNQYSPLIDAAAKDQEIESYITNNYVISGLPFLEQYINQSRDPLCH